MTTPALKALLEKTAFTDSDLALLLTLQEPTECRALYDEAYKRTEAVLGNAVYMRGLIEVSNLCVYDCRYCGIRKSNHTLTRYTLTKEEILQAAERSFRAGYYSLALQSGERDDARFVEFIADVLRDLHALSLSMGIQDGCGLTLSFGEQSCETYEYWAKASGNRNALRYLLRLETSNPKLFETIHGHGPRRKTLIERYMALSDLRRTGYQVGTGVMIGIPGQTVEDLVADLRAFERIDADMFGMGPYIDPEYAGRHPLDVPDLQHRCCNGSGITCARRTRSRNRRRLQCRDAESDPDARSRQLSTVPQENRSRTRANPSCCP